MDLRSATAALTSLVFDAARFHPGQRVLDVGCGIGAPACKLASLIDVQVVGISTSPKGVDQANRRATQAGLHHRVRFECRDGMENGLPDGSFDRLFALESSHLMRRRDALLRECARVLRPGGRLAMCDIVLKRELPFAEVRRLRESFSLLRDVFGDAHMLPLADYRQLALAHGLIVDIEMDLTADTRPTFSRWLENATIHREEASKLLGDAGWSAFVDGCGVLEGFWDDGTLGYGLLAAAKPG